MDLCGDVAAFEAAVPARLAASRQAAEPSSKGPDNPDELAAADATPSKGINEVSSLPKAGGSIHHSGWREIS